MIVVLAARRHALRHRFATYQNSGAAGPRSRAERKSVSDARRHRPALRGQGKVPGERSKTSSQRRLSPGRSRGSHDAVRPDLAVRAGRARSVESKLGARDLQRKSGSESAALDGSKYRTGRRRRPPAGVLLLGGAASPYHVWRRRLDLRSMGMNRAEALFHYVPPVVPLPGQSWRRSFRPALDRNEQGQALFQLFATRGVTPASVVAQVFRPALKRAEITARQQPPPTSVRHPPTRQHPPRAPGR